jgi:NAD(P)-dependent dehydrogenase (short-subunit alcohol dehydrogenase family)
MLKNLNPHINQEIRSCPIFLEKPLSLPAPRAASAAPLPWPLGTRGIRVNAVAPGAVETDMSNFTKTEAGREVAPGMQALKRMAQPDDIAPVVAFLASDNARWITGDTVRVDGGFKL